MGVEGDLEQMRSRAVEAKASRVEGREEEAEKALGRLREALGGGEVLTKKPGSTDPSYEKRASERFMHRCHCREVCFLRRAEQGPAGACQGCRHRPRDRRGQ